MATSAKGGSQFGLKRSTSQGRMGAGEVTKKMLKCAFSTCNSRKANTNYIVPREAYKDRPDPQARWSQHGPSASPRCKELWFPPT